MGQGRTLTRKINPQALTTARWNVELRKRQAKLTARANTDKTDKTPVPGSDPVSTR